MDRPQVRDGHHNLASPRGGQDPQAPVMEGGPGGCPTGRRGSL